MKSFVIIDQGLCVASGKDWHGHQINHPGPVFYICGEGHSGLSRRIRAWAIHNQVDLANVPFFVSERAARLLDEDGPQEVERAVDELVQVHGKPAMIIIDTLNRNFGGGGDENSTKDMTSFISTVDQSIRVRYGCCTAIVHHTGLASTERARGSSVLRAALDYEYSVVKKDLLDYAEEPVNPDPLDLNNAEPQRTGYEVIMTCTKAKDAAPPAQMHFMSEEIFINDWVDEDTGEPMASLVLTKINVQTRGKKRKKLSRTKQIAFDALLKLGKGFPVHIDDWKAEAFKNGITASSQKDDKRRTFQRAVKDLQADGLVWCNSDYWTPCSPESGQPAQRGQEPFGQTGQTPDNHESVRGTRLDGQGQISIDLSGSPDLRTGKGDSDHVDI